MGDRVAHELTQRVRFWRSGVDGQQVQAVRSQVRDPYRRNLNLTLPPSDQAPGLARDALSPLSGRLGETTFGELQLLVTELVTNSVRHAGLRRDQRIRVQVQLVDGTVRAEVREPGRGFEPPAPPTPDDGGGWGLFLVDRLARAWNVRGDDETTVWFELEA